MCHKAVQSIFYGAQTQANDSPSPIPISLSSQGPVMADADLYHPHHCHPLQPQQQPKKPSLALSVPPNDFSIHGNLLLPPNSLLSRSSSQAAEDIFGYDDNLLAQIADDRW